MNGKLEAEGNLIRFVSAPTKPHKVYMAMAVDAADAAEIVRRWNLAEPKTEEA